MDLYIRKAFHIATETKNVASLLYDWNLRRRTVCNKLDRKYWHSRDYMFVQKAQRVVRWWFGG